MKDIEFGVLALDCLSPAYVRSHKFQNLLKRCIDDVALDEEDRNLLTHSLSFVELRDEVWVIRFSPMDSKGRLFGTLSQLDRLYRAVIAMVGPIGKVLTEEDQDTSRYHHFYSMSSLAQNKNGRDYVYIRDSKFVKTIVVLLTSPDTIDCNDEEHTVA